jgi:hypothetical protein
MQLKGIGRRSQAGAKLGYRIIEVALLKIGNP